MLPRHFLPKAMLGVLVSIVLLFAPPLAAQKAIPSRPVLEKNAFLLTSSGFHVQLANDAATRKLMTSLPSHQFVVHVVAGTPRYLYADPNVCVCVYVGGADAYRSYRDMMTTHLQVDNVGADYASEINMLLHDPIDSNTLNNPTSLADFFRDNL